MAYDPNPASQAATRIQKMAHDQHQKWVDDNSRRHGPAGANPGSPLGFLIVVALIAIVGFWIASQQ